MEILFDHIRTNINDAVAAQAKYIAYTGMRCVEMWLKIMGY